MLNKLSNLSFYSFSVILFQRHLFVRSVIIPLPSLISFPWKNFKTFAELQFLMPLRSINFVFGLDEPDFTMSF
jgi:hypothetical protein